MNKQEYIHQLSARLSSLTANERAEILRDVEEHFREAMQAGRSEEAVVKQLGDPKAFADMMTAERKIKRIDSANTLGKKLWAVVGAAIAIVVLTPFNLIFVFLPLLLATLFIISGWPIVLILALSIPIAFIFALGMMIKVGFHLLMLLAIIFLLIGWGALVVAIFVGFYFLTFLYIKGITALFNWNLKFIKRSMR